MSTEPKEPASSTKPAGKGDAYSVEGRGGKYDKQLVVNLFVDGGKTPSEIAELGLAGIKGISPVYCHRILFGNEESGGINKGQAARRKEQAARVKAWASDVSHQSDIHEILQTHANIGGPAVRCRRMFSRLLRTLSGGTDG